jgi:hypothetical protein
LLKTLLPIDSQQGPDRILEQLMHANDGKI